MPLFDLKTAKPAQTGAFDLASARPAAPTKFDLATAKPAGRFDLATATPVAHSRIAELNVPSAQQIGEQMLSNPLGRGAAILDAVNSGLTNLSNDIGAFVQHATESQIKTLAHVTGLQVTPKELRQIHNKLTPFGGAVAALANLGISWYAPGKTLEVLSHLGAYRELPEAEDAFTHIEKLLRGFKTEQVIDRFKVWEMLKGALRDGLTPEMNEKLWHYEENKLLPEAERADIKLTPLEQHIHDTYLQPLREELNWTEGYMPREVMGRGGYLDQLLSEKRNRMGIGLLRTRSAADFSRKMFFLRDPETGARSVVHADIGRNGAVIKIFDNGAFHKLTTLRRVSEEDLLDKELAGIDSEHKTLMQELRTRTSTKASRIASWRRIATIGRKLDELDAERERLLETVDPEQLSRKVWIDRKGKTWQLTQAPTRDIEAATDLRYHKNSFGRTMAAYVEQRQAARQAAGLAALKQSPEFARIAVKGAQTPEGWKTTTLPNFAGYRLEPHAAEIFDHFAALQRGRTRLPLLGRINDLSVNVMFQALSLWHDFNLSDIATVSRGLSAWTTPAGYIRLLKTLGPAIRSVNSFDDDYLRLFAKDVPLKAIGLLDEKAYGASLRAIATELETKPELSPLTQALGYAPKQLAKVVRWWADHQISTMWKFNDVLLLQAIKETMLRDGVSEDEAIARVVNRHATYRLTTRYGALNAIAHPDVTWFAHYHLGIFRSWMNMGRDLVGRVPLAQRARALDQMAMQAILLFNVYPAIDTALQKMTGSDTAKVHRFGLSIVPYDLYKLTTGQESLSDALATQVFTFAPMTLEAIEQVENVDFWTKKPIAPYYMPPAQQAKMRAEHFIGSPLWWVAQMQREGLLSAVGVFTPPDNNLLQKLEEQQRQKMYQQEYWMNRGNF